MPISRRFATMVFLYLSLGASLLTFSNEAFAQYSSKQQSWLNTCEPEMQVVLSKTLGGVSNPTSMRIQMSRDVVGTANASIADIKSWLARGPGGDNPSTLFDYCLLRARLATETSAAAKPATGVATHVPIARPARKMDPRLLAKRDADEKLDHPWYERLKEVCAPEIANLMSTNSWPEHEAADDSYYQCRHAFEDKCPVPSYGHKVIPPGCPGAVGTSVASVPRTKSKCPAANEACPPPKGTQLRHTVKLGNPCISTELLKNELNYNNLATVELTNDCKVAQVIHTQSYLESAPYQLFHFTYPFGPKYYGWFGKYPPEFPFQPVEPVPVFTMHPGNKTRLNFEGGHTIVVETAACDYVGSNKVMNRIYTDFGLRGFTQMACRSNPRPPPKP